MIASPVALLLLAPAPSVAHVGSLVPAGFVASASVRQAPDFADLDPVLETIRETHDLPALGALILTSDGPVASGFVGTRQRGGEDDVTEEDLFHLGSCTKAMTSTLVALFIEKGLVAWNTTLADVFPELAAGMHETWRGVTLAQLVSHTAGAPADLRAYPMLGLGVTAGKKPLPDLRKHVVEVLTENEPDFEPGTSYGYSNWGYVIAGAVLETRTGKAWEVLIAEHLFEPLGMERVGFGPVSTDERPDQPCGHSAQGRPYPGSDNPATMGPAGTVHAPLREWAKFVKLHLRGARGEKGLLLTPDSFAALHEPRPGTKGAYGAGWVVTRRPWSEGTIYCHNGSNTLWFAWVWIAPEEDFAVLVACNQGGPAAGKGTDAAALALIHDYVKGLR